MLRLRSLGSASSVVVALVVLLACHSRLSPTVPDSVVPPGISVMPSGQEIQIRIGEALSILPPTEQADWQLDYAAEVLELLTPKNLVRFPGRGGWQFRGLMAGSTEVAIVARPVASSASSGPAPPRRYTLTVSVR